MGNWRACEVGRYESWAHILVEKLRQCQCVSYDPAFRILGSFEAVLRSFIFLDVEYSVNSCCVRKLPLSVAHAPVRNATPVNRNP